MFKMLSGHAYVPGINGLTQSRTKDQQYYWLFWSYLSDQGVSSKIFEKKCQSEHNL